MKNIFSEDKIKKLKKEYKIKNKDIFNILGSELIEVVTANLIPAKKIYDILKEELGNKYNVSYQAFNQYLNDVLKKETKELKKLEKIKKVAIINFKGGVGKSTIANLLDLPNKVVVNLDTQNAKNANYSDTVNYLELKSEYGVNVKEAIDILKEEGKEWIVFDTPGSITEELLEIIDDIDYIITPFTKGNRSKETTIDSIKSILDVMDNDKVKFALVLNMFQDENDLEEELKPIENEVKKILNDKYNCAAVLKFSKAVSTMEKTKKSIEELDLTNKIAYKAFKKRIKDMNEKLRSCLFKDNIKSNISNN